MSKPEDSILPAHPEDFDYVALLRSHDLKRSKWVVVPEGQSIELDEDARRPWLYEHLGAEWHLFKILPLYPETRSRT